MKPHIEQMMIDYIDQHLKDSKLAQQFVTEKNFRGLMVEAAKACVGIRELTGHNDGVLVNSIQRTVDGVVSHDEYWCMDFVMTIRSYAETKTGLASPLIYTQGCADLWRNMEHSHPDLKVQAIPLPGAIVYWRHAKGGGHTGIVLASDGITFYTIEGNASGTLTPITDSSGPVNRNGNGVYYGVRKHDSQELIGFIKPI